MNTGIRNSKARLVFRMLANIIITNQFDVDIINLVLAVKDDNIDGYFYTGQENSYKAYTHAIHNNVFNDLNLPLMPKAFAFDYVGDIVCFVCEMNNLNGGYINSFTRDAQQQ